MCPGSEAPRPHLRPVSGGHGDERDESRLPLDEHAHERIRADIVAGVLAPGATLTEAQLCADYGCSKAPVRLALARLAHDGLVSGLPRHGYRVAPVTLQDTEDCFDLRLLLEPPAARAAAGRIDASGLARLAELGRAGYTPGDAESTRRYVEAYRDFRVTIAQASGNRRLAQAIAQLLEQTSRLLHLGLALRPRAAETQREHAALLRALRRADADGAERICRDQIVAARDLAMTAALRRGSVADMAVPSVEP
jgi:DNA-binding GntR family transcriptional regulator